MSDVRAKVAQKEPVALIWIIVGLFAAVACMVGIERMITRY